MAEFFFLPEVPTWMEVAPGAKAPIVLAATNIADAKTEAETRKLGLGKVVQVVAEIK